MLRSKVRRVYIVIIYHNPICNILRGVCVTIWIERKLLIIVPLGSGNEDMESFFFPLAFFCAVGLFKHLWSVQFSCSVMSDSANPWTAAQQASLSITNTQSLPQIMSIKSEVPSNHLILCCPLLLPPSIFPSIRVFSNESTLLIRWPKY